jgi:hypothetical protein
VTLYHFTVSYEGEIEATNADTAREWAREDVEAGRHSIVNVEVTPIDRKERTDAD